MPRTLTTLPAEIRYKIIQLIILDSDPVSICECP